MKLSLKWLNALLGSDPITVDQLVTDLDLTGTAVDGVETTGPAYTNVVVGQVLSKERHPDSDHLWLTTVSVGSDPTDQMGSDPILQIVCGAQNFEKNDYVAVALVGAVLPGDFKIKRSKIRGQESQGMLCSETELGLTTEPSPGIMRLQESVKGLSEKSLGQPLEVVLGGQMGSDPILDLEITPNRADCMSVVGLAREVAAVYKLKVPYRSSLPELHYPSSELGDKVDKNITLKTDENTRIADLVQIKVDDDARCSRFVAFVIRNVKIGPSPAWLQERVNACGTRSINNVVDITNYIMYELGQPLHAYDFDTFAKMGSDPKSVKSKMGSDPKPDEGANAGMSLRGGFADEAIQSIVIGVRAAKSKENFTTLDKVERELDPDITVIFDGNAQKGTGQTIGLAGVMGGLDSEVTEGTTSILLEAAVFDPAHTSRSARKLKLFSEASARFERGVDAAQTLDAGRRAAEMIASLAGGELVAGYVEAGAYKPQQPIIELKIDDVSHYIGVTVPQNETVSILESIGCKVTQTKQSLQAAPPTFRADLTRPADLYEEVLRLYGMNKVVGALPINPVPNQSVLRQYKVQQGIVDVLLNDGFDEIMTYSFAAEQSFNLFGCKSKQPLVLANPINLEEPQLRTSLMPHLLQAMLTNQNQFASSVKLFEIGTVFSDSKGAEHPVEQQHLAIALSGNSRDESELNWADKVTPLSFYDLKGAVEGVLTRLNITSVTIAPLSAEEAKWLKSGAAAGIFTKALPGKYTNPNGHLIGWLGQCSAEITQQYGIKGNIFTAEIEVEPLLALSRPIAKFKELAKYPSVVLDVSFECPASLPNAEIATAIRQHAAKTLESLQIFDVFVDDKKLGAGKKAYTYKLTYRSNTGSLEQSVVQLEHQAMIDKVKSQLNLSVR